jgi:Mg/Co/Ni transporter MgtE
VRYQLQDKQKPATACGTCPDENLQAFSGISPGDDRYRRHKKKSLSEENTPAAPTPEIEVAEAPAKTAIPLQRTISIPKNILYTKKLLEEKKSEADTLILGAAEQKVEVVEKQSDKILTQELLYQSLPEILAHFKAQDKNMELAILQTIHVQDSKAILYVSGHVQDELAQKMRAELISVIREKTGVGGCKIVIESRDDLESNAKVYYTDSDKLQRLKELHPALADFQKRFGLETDF